MDDGVDVFHRHFEPGARDEVALHPVVALSVFAAEHACAMAFVDEASHDLAAECAGSAGDEHVHDEGII